MFTDHLVILPVLIPITGGIIAFLFKEHHRFQAIWSLLSMAAALACSTVLLISVSRSGAPMVLQVGNWPAPFGITLVADLLSALFVFMSQLVLVMGVLYANGSKDGCVAYPTFYPLFLFLASGLTGGFLAGDFFNLFVFVELLAISSTVLTAISDDWYGTEAAYKYFYLNFA